MNRRSKIVVSVAGILIVTLFLIGLTYGYYLTRINGNNNKSISLTSANLKLVYADGNGTITGDNIDLGWTTTKTFSVTNAGNKTISYSVIFEDIENNFQKNEAWKYLLKKGTVEVAKGSIAVGSHQILLGSVSIDPNMTDEYSLIITYENLTDVDQSEDMGKTLSFRVNIDDSVNTWDNPKAGSLLASMKRDNTVVESLTIPGQQSSLNNGYSDVFYDYNMSYSISKTNQSKYYFTYADSYSFNESTGKYTLVNPKVGLYSNIYSSLVGKYIVNYSGSTSSSLASYTNLSEIYKVTSATTNETDTLKVIYNLITPKGTEALLSSTEDDYGNSYYYRGVVKNNYVNFGGMCWRIVRVQGDGGIKITLADRDNECDSPNFSETSVDSAFIAPTLIDAKYFTYRIGSPKTREGLNFANSDALKTLNAWLNGGEYSYAFSFNSSANQKATFNKSNIDVNKLQDAEWCTDTSIVSGINYIEDEDTGDVTQTDDPDLATYSNYKFGATKRLYSKELSSPSLKCNFSGLYNSKSEKTSSKIGMLTADEMVFAGFCFNIGCGNNANYLIDNTRFAMQQWTLTPHSIDEKINVPRIITLNASSTEVGYASYMSVTSSKSIRPVVVLKSNVMSSSGNGTQKNPYKIN